MSFQVSVVIIYYHDRLDNKIIQDLCMHSDLFYTDI